jgi:preprotein translocase subunit YajC
MGWAVAGWLEQDQPGGWRGPGTRGCKARGGHYSRADFIGGQAVRRVPLCAGRRLPLAPSQAISAQRLDDMFITPAYAQTGAGGADFILQLVPILLMFVIFYFLLFRPQQQRAKQHREMIAAVKRNDTVVLSGGIHGKVTKVIDDTDVEVEIAPNTRVRVVRGTIAEVRARGEPVKDTA